MTTRKESLWRTTRLAAFLLLAVGVCGLPSAPGAVYSTLNDHTSDGLILSNTAPQTGGNPNGTRRIGSSSAANTGLNTAYFFDLPDAGLLMSTTQYEMEFHYKNKDASPTFNVDLYGLGYRSPSAALDREWFYEGPLDTTARSSYSPPTGSASAGSVDLIQAAVIAPTTTQDTRISVQSGELNQFVRSLYDDGAIGGDAAAFRLNAESDTTTSVPRSTGYQVVIDNSGGNAANRAELKALNVPFAGDTFDGIAPGETIGGKTSGAFLNGTPAWTNAWIASGTEPGTVVAPTTPLSATNSAGTLDGRSTALQIRGADSGNNTLNNNAARRALDTAYTGDELFVRYLARPTATDSAFDGNFFVLWLDNGAGGDSALHDQTSAMLGFSGETTAFARIYDNPGGKSGYVQDNFTIPGGLTLDEDYMLVGRLYRDGDGDGFNMFDFWLNPDSNDLNSPDGSVDLGDANTAFGSVTHLGFRSGRFLQPDDTYLVDGIALGTSWSQVVMFPVPEPATFTVWAGLLAAGLFLRWRRRR